MNTGYLMNSENQRKRQSNSANFWRTS